MDNHVFKEVHPDEFEKHVSRAQQTNLDQKRDYANKKTYLNQDNTVGYALRDDGYWGNLFSFAKGGGAAAAKDAIERGAMWGSVFDRKDGKNLIEHYKSFGLHPFAREKNWESGGPDVVYVKFNHAPIPNEIQDKMDRGEAVPEMSMAKSEMRTIFNVLKTYTHHPHAYEWHDGHTSHHGQMAKADLADEADKGKGFEHAQNPQVALVGVPTYHEYAKHYGTIDKAKEPHDSSYNYRDHTDAIDKMVKDHGYQVYFAGGKYGKPDLASKNYDTGHLMIYDPTPSSGGDQSDEAQTRNWRVVHELAHALTHKQINQTPIPGFEGEVYGERPRLGRLGGQRTLRDAMRAIHWEALAVQKQKELSERLGIKLSDSDFAKEWNTNQHDAAHRAVTGRFTEPRNEGFQPHDKMIPLEFSLDLARKAAAQMGMKGLDDLKVKKSEAPMEKSEHSDQKVSDSVSKIKALLEEMKEATALEREHVLDGNEHLHKADELPLIDLTSPEAHKAAHGRKVFVYFNLHKKLWSVKDMGTGRVILHSKNVSVQNPSFKVSEAGRQRVISEQRKNVHAGVTGILDTQSDSKMPEGSKKVSYNPYKAAHFYEVGTNEPVHSGSHAHLSVEEKEKEGKTVRIPHVFVHDAKGLAKSEDSAMSDKYKKASEILKACWEGYEQYGMKEKHGKQVPNCVPKKKTKKQEMSVMGTPTPPANIAMMKAAVEDMLTELRKEETHEYAGKMVKSNLYKLAETVQKLYPLFEDDDNVEPWVEEKIAVAASMMDSVSHYMEHEAVSEGKAPDETGIVEDMSKDEKKYSKKVKNPETGREKTVRYGAKGYTIAPGTSRGDSYCARSYGQMKDHPSAAKDANSPLRLSRKKWKCSGKTSRKSAEEINDMLKSAEEMMVFIKNEYKHPPLSLELVCGQTGVNPNHPGYWEGPNNFEMYHPKHAQVEAEAEKHGIQTHVSSHLGDDETFFSDAYMKFHPHQIEKVAQILKDVGHPGDILDIEKLDPKDYKTVKQVAEREGWTIGNDQNG